MVALLAAAATGQEKGGETLELRAISVLPSPAKRRAHAALTVGVGADVQSTLKDHNGYARATRESVLLALDTPLGAGAALSGSFEREASQYDLDLTPATICGIGHMQAAMNRFGLAARTQIAGKWTAFAIGDMTFSGENSAPWGDSMTYGGIVAVRRQVSDSFAWQVGVIAQTRLEDRAIILPVPGIDWKITDRLSLRTAQGATFSCDCAGNKRWIMDLGVNFDNRVYRMDRQSQLPGGIFIDRSIPLVAAITRRFWPGTFIRLSAATPLYRRYKFCDSDSETVENLDSNFFPSFTLSAGVAF